MKNEFDPANPNSGHGHVYHRPDGERARCGGPGICSQCSKDQAQKEAARQQAVPSGYVMVPVDTLQSWVKRLNRIAATSAFEVLAEIESAIAAAPQPSEGVCDTCHGQGEIWTGQNQYYGEFQPPEPIMEECPECGGEAPTAPPVTREVAERFLVDYHAIIWAAAEDEDSKIAYDDAGRDIAKAFLNKFGGGK